MTSAISKSTLEWMFKSKFVFSKSELIDETKMSRESKMFPILVKFKKLGFTAPFNFFFAYSVTQFRAATVVYSV